VLYAASGENLAALGAFLAGLGALTTAWISRKATASKAVKDCEARLRRIELEATELADKLYEDHRRRLDEGDEEGDE